MFTGIIEHTGKVVSNQKGKLSVKVPRAFLVACTKGESIAVNGICLTISGRRDSMVCFDVIPHTERSTTLKDLQKGDTVNIERALMANGRFDGHFVQGHGDTVGTIVEGKVRKAKISDVTITICVPYAYARYLVKRGSISVDGISLTVAAVRGGTFTVALIPTTLQKTNARYYENGTQVNIEFDILAKYVEALFKKSYAQKTTRRQTNKK